MVQWTWYLPRKQASTPALKASGMGSIPVCGNDFLSSVVPLHQWHRSVCHLAHLLHPLNRLSLSNEIFCYFIDSPLFPSSPLENKVFKPFFQQPATTTTGKIVGIFPRFRCSCVNISVWFALLTNDQPPRPGKSWEYFRDFVAAVGMCCSSSRSRELTNHQPLRLGNTGNVSMISVISLQWYVVPQACLYYFLEQTLKALESRGATVNDYNVILQHEENSDMPYGVMAH